jgi:hypothetical protein
MAYLRKKRDMTNKILVAKHTEVHDRSDKYSKAEDPKSVHSYAKKQHILHHLRHVDVVT